MWGRGVVMGCQVMCVMHDEMNCMQGSARLDLVSIPQDVIFGSHKLHILHISARNIIKLIEYQQQWLTERDRDFQGWKCFLQKCILTPGINSGIILWGQPSQASFIFLSEAAMAATKTKKNQFDNRQGYLFTVWFSPIGGRTFLFFGFCIWVSCLKRKFCCWVIWIGASAWKARWLVASWGVRQIHETERLWWLTGCRPCAKRFEETIDVWVLFFAGRARHCCKQLKDTIPSWKKDFVANHFCHNAAHSPNIHYICAA